MSSGDFKVDNNVTMHADMSLAQNVLPERASAWSWQRWPCRATWFYRMQPAGPCTGKADTGKPVSCAERAAGARERVAPRGVLLHAVGRAGHAGRPSVLGQGWRVGHRQASLLRRMCCRSARALGDTWCTAACSRPRWPRRATWRASARPGTASASPRTGPPSTWRSSRTTAHVRPLLEFKG